MQGVQRQDVLDALHERTHCLAELQSGPRSVAALVDRVPTSRATVDRVLDEFVEAGYVAETPSGYVGTQAGAVALRRYQDLQAADWSDDALDLVARREDFLAALSEERAHKPGIVDELGHSRSTVNRAIEALEDAGWVNRDAGGYGTSGAGEAALADYREYLADQRAVLDASDTLATLPADCEIPLSLVTEGTVATEDPRYRLFETLADRLRTASRYRVALPRIADSRQLRLPQQRVADGTLSFEFLAPGGVHERLVEEFPHLASDLAGSGEVSVRRGEVRPYGLLLLDDDGETTVVVVAYDEGVSGVLTATTPAAVAWAEDVYSDLRAATTDTAAAWETATASQPFARMTGERLPAQLRTQGFVRVDDAFLDDQEPLPPETAWRAGLGLADVDAGYAVPRHSDRSGEDDLATQIRRRLDAGEDTAVLGPTGSGKSTVCKRVAVDQARNGDGVVLYRESGYGQPFTAPGALTAVLERVSGPVLVVVEDAVRAETAPAFEVMEQFRGTDDVTFLVDARESEWTGPDDVLGTARLTAYRRNHVSTVHVPPLTETAVERILDHSRSLMDDLPAIPTDQLLTSVRSQSRETATPGAAFLLFHRLARVAAPLSDYQPGGTRSTLDEHVDRIHTDLAAMDDGALDVAALCTLLAAAGVGVSPGHLYALTARDAVAPATVGAAIERLDGDILFESGRDDGYRTIQRTWAVPFLHRLADLERNGGQRLLGRTVTALFALADDADRRERVARAVGGDASVLDAVLADPGSWADEMVRSCFEVGLEHPRLAPLFGTTDGSAIDLPDACSPATDRACVEWRGRMYAARGSFDRADREFERLVDGADAFDPSAADRARFAGLLGRCGVARQRGDFDAAAEFGRAARSIAETVDEGQAVGRARLALGRIASDRSAFDDATDHLRAALDAFDDAERLAHGAVWDELAEIATRRGDYDRARECYEESERIYEAVGNDRGTARALANAGDVAFQREDYETAVERFGRARDLVRQTGDRSYESDVLESMGASTFLRGDVAEAEAYYEQALSIARDVGERRRVASVLSDLAAVATYESDVDAATDYYDEALSLADDIDADELVVKCLRNMVGLEQQRGNLETATDHARDGVELAREIGNRQFEATCLRKLGLVLLRRGRHAEATEHLDAALELGREMDDFGAQAIAVDYLLRSALRLGDATAATAHAQAYHRLAESMPGDRSVGVPPAALFGQAALERGDVETAAARFRTVHDGDAEGPIMPALWLARAERRLGNCERAQDLVTAATDGASSPRLEGLCALEGARLDVATDDLDAAAEKLDAARDAVDGVDHSLEILVDCQRAALDRRRGATGDARDRFESAFDRYREIGADRRARQVAVDRVALGDAPETVRAAAGECDDVTSGPWTVE